MDSVVYLNKLDSIQALEKRLFYVSEQRYKKNLSKHYQLIKYEQDFKRKMDSLRSAWNNRNNFRIYDYQFAKREKDYSDSTKAGAESSYYKEPNEKL
jgi:hypothetical protein